VRSLRGASPGEGVRRNNLRQQSRPPAAPASATQARQPSRRARVVPRFVGTAVLGITLFVLGLTIAFVASPASAETGKKALVLDSTVSGGASSREAQRATALGFTVDVVNEEKWRSMTATEFADYQLIVLGDHCGQLPKVVSDNATPLADAVMGRAGGNTKAGNRLLIGTDPVFHYHQGGSKLVDAGIDFAGVQEGATGLYLDFQCGDPDYDRNGIGDGQEKLLPKLTVATPNWTQTSGACGDRVSLISNAAQFSSLRSSDLQAWGCSVHESFPTFPTDWTPLAVATDAPTKPTCGKDVDTGETACGEAYLLIAGSGIVSEAPNLSLSPTTDTNPIGTPHTVTATVTKPDGSPSSGVHVSFVVTGANAEAAGTCVPASCDSDEAGKVTFTYTGTKEGDDTINASITVSGSTQTATAAKTWTTPTETTPTETTPTETTPTETTPTETTPTETTPTETTPTETTPTETTPTETTPTETTPTETTPPPPPPPPPAISINDITVTESAGGPATFTVRLDKASEKRVTVAYTTADGSARAPGDYAQSAGSVTFAPGETTKSLTVTLSDDTTDEPEERFVVKLSNPSNATIQHDTGTAFLQDDADPPPTVSVVGVTVVEGDPHAFLAAQSHTSVALFTLQLSEASGKVVTVDYTTADGTARSGVDYTATSGTATFQPGETRRTVSVPITPNNNDELDRSFSLRLAGGSNASVNQGAEAQATIQDDDPPAPPVAGESGNASVKEGTILVKLPGTDVFVPLTGPVQLPIGTVVDATKGTVTLQMSDGAGGTYTGDFWAGVFTILEQTRGVVRKVAGADAKKPKKKAPKKKKAKKQATVLFTTLRLEGGDFGICTGSRMLAAKEKPKPVRRLWGDTKGKFRTKGRHSAATVRGTRWLTSDRCDGTLTYVSQGGPVSVLDFRLRKTIELREGQMYVAKARAGRRR
jgi:Calx-beta domain/Bacterial Ig-like domain (group 1)